ncbi:MAG: hypothetical protein ACTHKE_04400 [Sphingomicrobium sp.]
MKNLTPISPKVIVAAIVGIILTSVVSNVGSIDPSAFDFLGPWKLFVLGTLLTLITSAAAWWKTDPLRVLPEDQENAAADAPAVTVPSVPAPIVVKPNTPVDLNASTSAALAASSPAAAPTADVAPVEDPLEAAKKILAAPTA